jgi:hypothetical protein
MPVRGDTRWDQIEARRLWDAMEPLAAIARAVGTGQAEISSFAARHWPPRPELPKRPRRTKKVRRRKLTRGEATLPPLPSLSDD